MSRARQISNRLGKSGIAFLIALALYIVFYFTGQELLLVLDLFAILPIAFILAFRFFRSARQNALWSLRNRLLIQEPVSHSEVAPEGQRCICLT